VDATEVAAALSEWASETCADLNNAYNHDPKTISHALPIATAGVTNEAVVQSDPTLGIAIADLGIQQASLHVLRSTILLIVDETPGEEAAQQLEGFVAEMAAALKVDETLGGRVPGASPFWSATYEPPFIEFDDTIKGRAAYFSLVVAELI
jgi:hypothetical protein